MNNELKITNDDLIEDCGCCNEPSDAQLIESMNIPFKPVDERILVKPLKPIMLTVTHDVIDEDAMDEEKELDANGVPTLKTKTVTEELESVMRIGVILSIAENKWTNEPVNTIIPPYKVGDKVVYVHKAAMPFDLIKDSVLLRKYDIQGLWLKDIE